MNESAVRVRYAKAFFSLAKEKKMLPSLKTDIEKISDVCTHSHDFVNLLESPLVNTPKKAALIKEIFSTEINPLTLSFLILITNNKREGDIPGICRNFLELTRKDQNIKSAVLITATELNTKTTDKIKALMEKELNATVELSTQIKPEIIGGLIIRVDDKQFDSSVVTRLKKIRLNLLGSEIR